jgi:V-type H+-transporting ATPase subunit a
MYGDIGHGAILTLAALYLVVFEKYYLRLQQKNQLNEIFSMAFGGRYVLLLMGLFALYSGFVYSDLFSVAPIFFESGFAYDKSTNQYSLASRPYPFGIDAVWSSKVNELAFYNSFKMKLSVIIGVTQMAFGIFLSLANHIYFKDTVSALFEFIPRIIFLLAVFGYMDVREKETRQNQRGAARLQLIITLTTYYYCYSYSYCLFVCLFVSVYDHL